MNYQLALFDFDGTLADSFPWFCDIVNQLADKYRFNRVAPEERESLRGCDSFKIIQHLNVPVWKLPMIGTDIKRSMARDIHQIMLFPGIHEVLLGLKKKGVGLGIVSSNAAENIRAALGPEISALIDDFECGASLTGKAPRIRKILSKRRVSPERAILIGDVIQDLESAREARVAFGAVSWGYNSPESLAARRPDLLFGRVEEILEKIG